LKPAELLLRHQRLEERVRALEAEIRRLEEELASNAEVAGLTAQVEAARRRRQEVTLELRSAEREVEEHRERMRTHERELMSGRIRNPSQLIQLSAEVEHMKARLGEEEDAALAVMEEAEEAEAEVSRLEAALRAASERAEAAAPQVRSRLEHDREQLGQAEAERDEVWRQVPPEHQAAYRRLRVQPPVAEVAEGHCRACQVRPTSSAMQQLRRGEEVVHCDNCGRILVMA
jgi:predicted  nucleic acid-binding Zn-ribbon protein